MKRKYKVLLGGARSYTEGITSILCDGFRDLGEYAMKTHTQTFSFDLLKNTSVPDLSSEEWYKYFTGYIPISKWFDKIGCSLDYIADFTLNISFDFTDIYDGCREYGLSFKSKATIIDDRGREHTYNNHGTCWVPK